MKKLTTLMAAGLAVLAYHTVDAQVGLHVSFNFGNVPTYQTAPVAYSGYDNDDYYYLPDVEAYYSVPQHCYYYNDGRQWVSATYLPGAYRNYDWRNARHYEIRGERPFMHHDMYRSRFGGMDPRMGGFGGPQFANRVGFGSDRGGFDRLRNDDRGFGGPDRGNFDNRDRRYPDMNQNRGGFDQPQNNRGGFDQNRGGFDQNRNGGQFQNDNQNRGGFDQNRGGGQFQNQNGNAGQNRGGGNSQPGNGGQFQNGNGGQNRGGGMDQQPANNNGGQNGQQGRGGRTGFADNNHFAANEMGVVRPPRM